MSVIVVIPARFGSSRFPGKPLLQRTGKFLIQHVFEQAQQALHVDQVIVATDDPRILDAVRGFGGTAVLTSTTHQSGTDRIAEVANMPEFSGYQFFINVQGDEPEIPSQIIDDLALAIQNPKTYQGKVADIATAAAPFFDVSEVANPHVVKVVVDQDGYALYFSRSVIPYMRDQTDISPLDDKTILSLYRKHIGIYSYHRDWLLKIAASPPCPIEKMEKLEQLRALFLGANILVRDVPQAPHGIDTPADYEAFIRRVIR